MEIEDKEAQDRLISSSAFANVLLKLKIAEVGRWCWCWLLRFEKIEWFHRYPGPLPAA